MDNEKIIGQRINSALAAKNLKQKDLAKHLGVTDNTISYFCSGSRLPNTLQIIKISEYLGVSTDYLLGLDDNKTTDTELKAVCKYTGLNETALNSLISLKDMHLCNIVDFFVSNKGFTKMLCYLDAMKRQLSFIADEYGLGAINRTFEHIFIDDFYKRIQNGEDADFCEEITFFNGRADNTDLAIYNILKIDAEKCFEKIIDEYSDHCVSQVSELIRISEENED